MDILTFTDKVIERGKIVAVLGAIFILVGTLIQGIFYVPVMSFIFDSNWNYALFFGGVWLIAIFIKRHEK